MRTMMGPVLYDLTLVFLAPLIGFLFVAWVEFLMGLYVKVADWFYERGRRAR